MQNKPHNINLDNPIEVPEWYTARRLSIRKNPLTKPRPMLRIRDISQQLTLRIRRQPTTIIRLQNITKPQ